MNQDKTWEENVRDKFESQGFPEATIKVVINEIQSKQEGLEESARVNNSGRIQYQAGFKDGKHEGYEKGFQDGHKKERWLKEEVEKIAKQEGIEEEQKRSEAVDIDMVKGVLEGNSKIRETLDIIKSKAKQEERERIIKMIEKINLFVGNYDKTAEDIYKEILTSLKNNNE